MTAPWPLELASSMTRGSVGDCWHATVVRDDPPVRPRDRTRTTPGRRAIERHRASAAGRGRVIVQEDPKLSWARRRSGQPGQLVEEAEGRQSAGQRSSSAPAAASVHAVTVLLTHRKRGYYQPLLAASEASRPGRTRVIGSRCWGTYATSAIQPSGYQAQNTLWAEARVLGLGRRCGAAADSPAAAVTGLEAGARQALAVEPSPSASRVSLVRCA